MKNILYSTEVWATSAASDLQNETRKILAGMKNWTQTSRHATEAKQPQFHSWGTLAQSYYGFCWEEENEKSQTIDGCDMKQRDENKLFLEEFKHN